MQPGQGEGTSTIPPPNLDTIWGSFDRPAPRNRCRDYAAPATQDDSELRGAQLRASSLTGGQSNFKSSIELERRRTYSPHHPRQPLDPLPNPLVVLLRERQPHRVPTAAVDEEG